LWISDGTNEGTKEILFDTYNISRPTEFYKFKDKLFAFAYDKEIGFEPYLIYLNPISTSTREQIKNNKIDVFPNPSTGIINVHSNNLSYPILNLYNSLGEHISVSEKSTQLDISKFKNGIYFLEVQYLETNQRDTKKILLSK